MPSVRDGTEYFFVILEILRNEHDSISQSMAQEISKYIITTESTLSISVCKISKHLHAILSKQSKKEVGGDIEDGEWSDI